MELGQQGFVNIEQLRASISEYYKHAWVVKLAIIIF